ncbi:hypothetical protein HGM15179_006856 [Zosterops borbonicus]|uniref:Uncharacterized protein n=1 Tax=Zosterops borbonicus TaxID=364589 RepID=A0A8K1GJU6_9PASS|nr:hypothetical protein HGM15179_006856 [Zosterops borbonicus]
MAQLLPSDGTGKDERIPLTTPYLDPEIDIIATTHVKASVTKRAPVVSKLGPRVIPPDLSRAPAELRAKRRDPRPSIGVADVAQQNELLEMVPEAFGCGDVPCECHSCNTPASLLRKTGSCSPQIIPQLEPPHRFNKASGASYLNTRVATIHLIPLIFFE